MASLGKQISHAWNAFSDAFRGRRSDSSAGLYSGWSGQPPGRQRFRVGSERTILASIYVRIAIDFATIDLRHARIGENGEFLEDIHTNLHNCLSLDPNLDQSARALKQDLAMTMCERGYLAVVPIDTTIDPNHGSFDILSIRVGHIVSWEPSAVWVSLYNEDTGTRQDILVPKKSCAIIENPFYDVMNEHNSTLQRLLRKLALLDAIDDQIGSNKLDMIIQLPYVIKSDARRQQAERRSKDVEDQLSGSKYGIAYIDGTERITQLNRPVENTLVGQVADLKKQVYEELGMTPEVLAGTADEQTQLNYFNSTIEPIATAVTEEFTRKFLTKTARTQKQRVVATRNPFKFVPINNIAEIADKFTRNEIMTSNEIRAVIGMYPSKDPKADELRNSNIAAAKQQLPGEENAEVKAEFVPLPKKRPKEIEAKPEEKRPEKDSQNGT